jgi:hypothetical protein
MTERRLRLLERTQNRLALIAILAAVFFGLAQLAASVITAGPDSWIREVLGRPKPPLGAPPIHE